VLRCFQTDNGMLIVKTLIKKIDMTGNIDRQRGSGRPCNARMPANINEVVVLNSHSAKKINHRQLCRL